MMKRFFCLSTIWVVVTAFAFVNPALAGKGGVKGSSKHEAFNAYVANAVPCADSVALVPEGTIAVGLDIPQCFTYDMVIEDAAAGSVHRDELTANWDLDGASEAAVDDATGFGGNAATEDAATGGGEGGVLPSAEDTATGTAEEEAIANGAADDGNVFDDPVCIGDATLCDGNGYCADGVCDGNYADGICDDGTCDGVDVLYGCNDGTCDGLSVTATNLECTVFASQPDSAIKNNDGNVPAKQPEIIIVTIDSINNADNECVVQVSARTVLNPGKSDPGDNGDFECDSTDLTELCAFEPQSCEPFREFTRDPDNKLDGIIVNDDGLPFINFETLNMGIKSFNPDGSIIVNGNGFVATKLSVELEPIGCDTDGDGFTDAEEVLADTDPLDPDDFPIL
jgi:hypothetical protein